ncbi:hypothetical protein [Mariniflexile maritimum]|uniref:hypothetical protein n=1 Tax=Mariniflexile maritimum TaxID=2682493 RepID=UPI0012F680BF|nr:hypothetical protein [Mariniflexile maritimum]MCB0449254.1 hypothetical protein [Confluentibacter sp.]
MKYILGFLLVCISLLSCTTNDTGETSKIDYLIFGRFYGMCIGKSCVTNYKLTNSTLFADTNNDYSHTAFNFVALDADKFGQVNDLMDFFPSKLLNEKETVLGCPDCYDQGGVFIQISKNGVVKSWRIDTNKNDVPAYLHSFMDKVNEKMALLSK